MDRRRCSRQALRLDAKYRASLHEEPAARKNAHLSRFEEEVERMTDCQLALDLLLDVLMSR